MDTKFSFKDSVKKLPDVLLKQVGATCVLLNLATESYYGLDEIGYDFYQKLVSSDSIEAAYLELLQEYESTPTELRDDLQELIENLLTAQVITIHVA
jgi:hypothetical protein